MRVQVMFDMEPLDLDPPRQTTEAIVLFEDAVRVYWPFDGIFEALGYYYNLRRRDDIPQIYPVHYAGRVIGYMVRAAGLTREERDQLFWEIMEASGRVTMTDSGFEYDSGEPFFVDGYEAIGNDKLPVGIVAYVEPEGDCAFPHEAVNYALERLMGQPSWPEKLPLYPMPGRKGTSSEIKALWIAPPQDDLNDADRAAFDDERIRIITRCNGWRADRRHPEYKMEEFQV